MGCSPYVKPALRIARRGGPSAGSLLRWDRWGATWQPGSARPGAPQACSDPRLSKGCLRRMVHVAPGSSGRRAMGAGGEAGGPPGRATPHVSDGLVAESAGGRPGRPHLRWWRRCRVSLRALPMAARRSISTPAATRLRSRPEIAGLVGTLARDPSVRIGPEPGTTIQARVFPVRVGGTRCTGWWTRRGPSGRGALDWMRRQETDSASRPGVVGRFVEAQAGGSSFPDECELLQRRGRAGWRAACGSGTSWRWARWAAR